MTTNSELTDKRDKVVAKIIATHKRKQRLYQSPEFKEQMRLQRIALMGYDFAAKSIDQPPTT